MRPTGVPCRPNREAQVYNLGPRGVRIRLVVGLVLLVATVAYGVCLVACDAHRLWRASVFMPVFFVNLLFMQARARTCVVLAALGAWDLGCGVQRVPDRNLEKRLRHRAYVLLSATLLATVAITILFVVI